MSRCIGMLVALAWAPGVPDTAIAKRKIIAKQLSARPEPEPTPYGMDSMP